MKVWTDCKICKKIFKEEDHIISLPLWYPDFINLEFGHLKCVQEKIKEDSNKISIKTLRKYLCDNNWGINKHSEYLDKAVYLDPQNRFKAEKPFTMFPKSDRQTDYKNRLNQIIQTLSNIINIPKNKIREELIRREFNAGNKQE